jgi:hypothetical protein
LFQLCSRFSIQTMRLTRAVEHDLNLLFATATPGSQRSLVAMFEEVVESARNQYNATIQKMEQVTRIVVDIEGDGNLGGAVERIVG